MAERKPILLRLDPAVYDALARWAGDELRSTNAQIEMVLRRALTEAGRHPAQVSPLRRPGRPRKNSDTPSAADAASVPDQAGAPDAVGTPEAVSTPESRETS